jgi:hypothetical protein
MTDDLGERIRELERSNRLEKAKRKGEKGSGAFFLFYREKKVPDPTRHPGSPNTPKTCP